MRITLNLATRAFADIGPAIKQLRMSMGVLVLLNLGLFLGLHAVHQKAESARAQEHSLDGAIAHISAERQGYQSAMQQPLNAQLLTQADALNQLFDQKAFSWTLAMESLETVLPGGVQVTAIEPIRNKDGHITLHLRVVGPRDKSEELVKNLEHSRRFLEPRIVGENAASNDNPNQRLEPVSASNRFDFELLSEYNPPVTEERKGAASTKVLDTDHKSEENPGARVHRPISLVPRTGRPPYTGQPHPAPMAKKPARAPMQSKPNPALAAPPTQGGSR